MVARFVTATIRGIRDNGMFATAKHFPGHGDTETDSHLSLPTITAPWARFDTLELVPFRAAIAAGVDAVMSAHIALPALDPGQQRPGTLSPPILTGILRDSLHFNGLITTDALNMGAIVKEVGADEAPVLAFLAGSDLLLMPTDVGRAIDAMVRAVDAGRISRARVDQSVRKILEMKERLGLFEHREVDLDRVSSVVGRAEFREIGAAVSQRSITLLKDSLGLVDGLARRRRPIGQPGRHGRERHDARHHARRRVAAQGLCRAISSPCRCSPIPPRAIRCCDRSTPSSVALVAASVRVSSGKGTISLPPGAEQAIKAIAARQPTVLISFGSPYLITQVPIGGELPAGVGGDTDERDGRGQCPHRCRRHHRQVADPDSARVADRHRLAAGTPMSRAVALGDVLDHHRMRSPAPRAPIRSRSAPRFRYRSNPPPGCSIRPSPPGRRPEPCWRFRGAASISCMPLASWRSMTCARPTGGRCTTWPRSPRWSP